ncbi:MAG: hypothetical protein IJO57_00445 [Bacilli bacterium]|nr:hypothetical protein [Bacilli bacterium]
MINFLEYFYNIKINKINNNHKYYSFNHNNYLYKLYIYEENNDINLLYNICQKLSTNTLISEIIKNKNNEIITTYNNINYILIKIYINPKKEISLNEISHINNSLYTENLNIDWGQLWSKKIDYLENLIHENGKKYPLITDSFNYYVGLAENAISYYNNIEKNDNQKYYITHKKIKINDTIESLYNPLNIIFDYKVRDLAEYIKISFFKNNKNIFNELSIYLKNNNLSQRDIKLLISRILYPSFYFYMYEDIIIDEKEEKIILKLIERTDNYELYLLNIISFLKRIYDIEEIKWLKKNED